MGFAEVEENAGLAGRGSGPKRSLKCQSAIFGPAGSEEERTDRLVAGRLIRRRVQKGPSLAIEIRCLVIVAQTGVQITEVE